MLPDIPRSLFLSPHNDDETLFGSYSLLRYKPTVIVCLWGTTQNGIGGDRVAETEAAMSVLGVTDFRQWGFRDDAPDVAGLERALRDFQGAFDMVFAPMVEQGGHEQHNLIGRLAREVFPEVRGYATYSRGAGRTQTANEVGFEPGWPALKFSAMACYRSQIGIENTRPWFFDDDAYREWYE